MSETTPAAVGGQGERRVNRLPYETAFALLADYRNGVHFTLHYHGKDRAVTSVRIGDTGYVWVCAGAMLPVHIRADGTSKDGPNIWMTANAELRGATDGQN